MRASLGRLPRASRACPATSYIDRRTSGAGFNDSAELSGSLNSCAAQHRCGQQDRRNRPRRGADASGGGSRVSGRSSEGGLPARRTPVNVCGLRPRVRRSRARQSVESAGGCRHHLSTVWLSVATICLSCHPAAPLSVSSCYPVSLPILSSWLPSGFRWLLFACPVILPPLYPCHPVILSRCPSCHPVHRLAFGGYGSPHGLATVATGHPQFQTRPVGHALSDTPCRTRPVQ